MTDIYHVAAPDGTKFGLMDKVELRTKWESGALPADALAWKEGWADWRPVSELFPSVAPPVPTERAWGVLSALKSVYLSRYCDFSGRAGREEFWFATIATWVGGAIFSLLGGLACGLSVGFGETPALVVLCLFFLLLTLLVLYGIIPSLSVMVRRLHDIGLSGWLILPGLFIPTFGQLGLLVCAVLPPAGPNRWGQRAATPCD